MIQSFVLSLFLYFPEDKTEYIPAAISCLIFFIGAVIAMRLIIRKSRKDEEKGKKFEEELLKNPYSKEDGI
jgi:hypothetical protein